jgi:hypothetical protein
MSGVSNLCGGQDKPSPTRILAQCGSSIVPLANYEQAVQASLDLASAWTQARIDFALNCSLTPCKTATFSIRRVDRMLPNLRTPSSLYLLLDYLWGS